MHISRENSLSVFCLKYNLNFSDLGLLNSALSHSSYTKEQNLEYNFSYERLEFLGDAVLKISISEFLFKNFPNAKEGELTQYRAIIVSDKSIADFAKKINLGELILTGVGEKRALGASKSSILACAFEALLGAIFLENGLNMASEFIFSNFQAEIGTLIESSEFSNPKAVLQEFTQSKNGKLPEYKVEDETGLSHNKTFKIGVYFEDVFLGFGVGKSKKEAEQFAAREALVKLNLLKEK